MANQTTRLPFELDVRAEAGALTAHGGVPLLIEAFRISGAAAVLDASVAIKRRKRGLTPAELVEGLFSLWAAGGERCEDLEALREDAALALLLGHGLPAPQTARDFLDAFDQAAPPLWQGTQAVVAGEGDRLLGLAKGATGGWWPGSRSARHGRWRRSMSTRRSWRAGSGARWRPTTGGPATSRWWRCGRSRTWSWPTSSATATSRPEAGIGASSSRRWRRCHRGVEEVRLRGDSALYEQALLRWLDGKGIGYAISADLSRELAAAIRALPESAWETEREDADAVRQWAEVAYVPSDGVAAKGRPAPPRYLAIRITRKQGALFADGSGVKHFAIVTNRPDPDGRAGLDLIRWHRGKAGTVEHTHHVLTNELAAEALPSQKFGANAAWFRLNVMLYNLLSAFKRAALPPELHDARPKRLRFVLLNGLGKVVRHARETVLRLVGAARRKLADGARVALGRGPPAVRPA